jgi:uncharacterized protein (TIGR03435 family)
MDGVSPVAAVLKNIPGRVLRMQQTRQVDERKNQPRQPKSSAATGQTAAPRPEFEERDADLFADLAAKAEGPAHLEQMMGPMHHSVVDKSGIAAQFDFHLEFAPDEATRGFVGRDAGGAAQPAAPVIDHVEKPSEN